MRATVTVQVSVEVLDEAGLHQDARQQLAGQDGGGADAFIDTATATSALCLTRIFGARAFDALGAALADVPSVAITGVWVPDSGVTVREQ